MYALFVTNKLLLHPHATKDDRIVTHMRAWKPRQSNVIILSPHLDDRQLQHLHCDNSKVDSNSCGKKPVYSQIHYRLPKHNLLEDLHYHGEHNTQPLHLFSERI